MKRSHQNLQKLMLAIIYLAWNYCVFIVCLCGQTMFKSKTLINGKQNSFSLNFLSLITQNVWLSYRLLILCCCDNFSLPEKSKKFDWLRSILEKNIFLCTASSSEIFIDSATITGGLIDLQRTWSHSKLEIFPESNTNIFHKYFVSSTQHFILNSIFPFVEQYLCAQHFRMTCFVLMAVTVNALFSLKLIHKLW